LALDKGRIVQRGKHEELLEQGGLYREIYDLQLRDKDQLRRELTWLSESAGAMAASLGRWCARIERWRRETSNVKLQTSWEL